MTGLNGAVTVTIPLHLTRWAGELRAWSAARLLGTVGMWLTLSVGLALAVHVVSAPWWAWFAVPLVAAGLSVSVVGAVRAPLGAEFLVCDLAPAVGSVVALFIALPAEPGLIAAAVLPAWAAIATALALVAGAQRLDRLALARSRDDGESCTTCSPLIPGRR